MNGLHVLWHTVDRQLSPPNRLAGLTAKVTFQHIRNQEHHSPSCRKSQVRSLMAEPVLAPPPVTTISDINHRSTPVTSTMDSLIAVLTAFGFPPLRKRTDVNWTTLVVYFFCRLCCLSRLSSVRGNAFCPKYSPYLSPQL
jgi:hypothetical protein